MPQYYQEGNIPKSNDKPTDSLQKLNSLALDDSDVVQIAKNILAVTSVDGGEEWVAFPDYPCKQISPVNLSGADIDVIRTEDDVWLTMISGMFWTFRGLTNANQISIRRNDGGTDQIAIVAEAEG